MKYSYSGDGKRGRQNKYSDIYVFLFCVFFSFIKAFTSFPHLHRSQILTVEMVIEFLHTSNLSRIRSITTSCHARTFFNTQSNYNLLFRFAPDFNLFEAERWWMETCKSQFDFLACEIMEILKATTRNSVLAERSTHLTPACANAA